MIASPARDAAGRILYDASPPCLMLDLPWQHEAAGELACSKPRGHGGKCEPSIEADGRSAYRQGWTERPRSADGTEVYHQGGSLDWRIVQIGPLGPGLGAA